MDWLVIDGARPYDGRYELDLAGMPPTSREWGWIKRLSGYLPGNVEDGFRGGDPELFCVLAAVALRRAGKIETAQVPETYEKLADAPFGAAIRFESDTVEDGDADSPPLSSKNGSEPTSGPGSPTSSETSAQPTPAPSGTPVLATSEFNPIKWGN
jgi:hypothetical protein